MFEPLFPSTPHSQWIGLMSGTSMDGVDGVVLQLPPFSANTSKRFDILAHAHLPFPPELRAQCLALNSPGHNELHRAALASNQLAQLYAQVVAELLRLSKLSTQQISAIGAHGQTIRHQPLLHDEVGYTWQLNNPSLLAELTNIDVVSDFRSRDLACGGQGAPLVPAFHQAFFAQPDHPVALLNLGGIANLSLLPAWNHPDKALGFDTGPANCLMDAWIQRHQGESFDRDGLWAASGTVNTPLLEALLTEPYFALSPPKSTGLDLFNLAWLDAHLQKFPPIPANDVQATLLRLTAQTCQQALLDHAPKAHQLWVFGGGALNRQLMQALQMKDLHVSSSADLGMSPVHMEAAAFAWLASQTLHRRPGNLPAATGARQARPLGQITWRGERDLGLGSD